MDIGHKETAGIAAQIAEVANAATLELHNAIEVINRPGAGSVSTNEAAQLVSTAFANLATLHVSRVYQQEMMLGRLNGDSLQDVRDALLGHLVETTCGMSAPTALDAKGNPFPVGALTRHFQEQLADAYSQAICSLNLIISTAELAETFGEDVFIFGLDEHDPDQDTGGLPPEVLAAAHALYRHRPVAAGAA